MSKRAWFNFEADQWGSFTADEWSGFIAGPVKTYKVAAAHVFTPGSASADLFVAGASAVHTFTPGSAQGNVYTAGAQAAKAVKSE